jgi:hypothetical protein
MNELIELIDHMHNILSSVLIKYSLGIELTDDEEEVISQLYISSEDGDLKALEDIPHKNNIYINTLIMTRTKGAKNKIKTVETENLNQENIMEGQEVKPIIDERQFEKSFDMIDKSGPLSDRKLTLSDILSFEVKTIEGRPYGQPDGAWNQILQLLQDPQMTKEGLSEFCKFKLSEEAMTIRSAAKFALRNFELDKKTGSDLYDSYRLIMKIEDGNNDIPKEQIEEIKKAVMGVFKNIDVIGFVVDALNKS